MDKNPHQTNTIRAGFYESDITPPLGTQLGGWLSIMRPAQQVNDPIFAKALVLESEGERVAFVSLDVLAIRWSDVNDIRRRAASSGERNSEFGITPPVCVSAQAGA